MWEDDKACGLGTLEYSNGDLYEGEWDNDQRHGAMMTLEKANYNHLLNFFFHDRKWQIHLFFKWATCYLRGCLARRCEGLIYSTFVLPNQYVEVYFFY